MIFPDLTFNLLLAGVDVVVVAFCVTQRRGARPLTLLMAIPAIFVPAVFLAIMFVAARFGLGAFGCLRMAAFAGSIHLPVVLVGFGWVVREHRIWRSLALASGFVLLSAAIYAFHVEPYRLEVTEFAVTSPRLKGLTRPIRMVQVADIQTDTIGPYEKRVIAELKRIEPDLVLFLGDYIQVDGGEALIRVGTAFNQLLADSGIRPPFGSYAVQGDCEGRRGWEELFSGTGVEPLHNEVRTIKLPGVAINLIGIDNPHSRTRDPNALRDIAESGKPGLLDIYAGHSPDYSEPLAVGNQPFLALAGHTHGGQVRIPFWGAPVTFSRLGRRFSEAFIPFGPGVLSVSRGLGMERGEAPRVRLFCRPELRSVVLMPPDGSEVGDGIWPVRIPDSHPVATEYSKASGSSRLEKESTS
jgi:hypothetical protein